MPGFLIALAERVYLDYNLRRFGRIAQLVRALLSHSRGPGFESLCAHKTTSEEVVFCINNKKVIRAFHAHENPAL